VLLAGDISILYLSVWVTLTLRHFRTPDIDLAIAHLTSFSFLFSVWFIIYFLSGLYGRYTVLFRKKLPNIIFVAQTINVGVAALLFFSIPFFQITPKTILVIYLLVSTALLYFWRVYMYPNILVRKEIGAVLVGTSLELSELSEEVNRDPLYPLEFRAIIHPELSSDEEIKKTLSILIESGSVSTIVADANSHSLDNILPYIYELTFIKKSAEFIEVRSLYQEVFERVPISLISDRWLLNNVNVVSHRVYDALKRVVDVVASLVLGVVAIAISPFVAFAIKMEDGGPALIKQRRIGRHAKEVVLYKFRSMTGSDDGIWIDRDGSNGINRVTKVGQFLRKTRIDELPQLWNVLKGDISLVGPRPDIVGLYEALVETVPFYKLRYAVAPGLTGWAQTAQVYEDGNSSPQSIRETRMRLQYDLYYVQNRSLLLDARIIFKTFKVVLTKLGS